MIFFKVYFSGCKKFIITFFFLTLKIFLLRLEQRGLTALSVFFCGFLHHSRARCYEKHRWKFRLQYFVFISCFRVFMPAATLISTIFIQMPICPAIIALVLRYIRAPSEMRFRSPLRVPPVTSHLYAQRQTTGVCSGDNYQSINQSIDDAANCFI